MSHTSGILGCVTDEVGRTAFFVLGLIASTVEGVEILDELNWESVLSPLGRAMGICVPRNVTTFVDVSASLLDGSSAR